MADNETKSHVLVVDDDPAVGMVLTALLQQAGFRATSVPSGRAPWRCSGASRSTPSSPICACPGWMAWLLLAHVERGVARGAGAR